jgi:hypothetical protein
MRYAGDIALTGLMGAGGALLADGLAGRAYGTHTLGASDAIGVVDGRPITMQDLVEAHQRGDHVVNGGPEVGAFWATNIQSSPPARSIEQSLAALAGVSPAEVMGAVEQGAGVSPVPALLGGAAIGGGTAALAALARRRGGGDPFQVRRS